MGLANGVTPVPTADRDNLQLGEDDGTADGGGNLLGALDAEADVAVEVTDNDEGLEAGALTGTGLLLHGHNLHHLVLEGSAEEELDDLVLLDGHGEEVDLLERLNLALGDETAELGAGHPLLLVIPLPAPAPAATATVAATTVATATVPTATLAEATAEATTPTVSVSHSAREGGHEQPSAPCRSTPKATCNPVTPPMRLQHAEPPCKGFWLPRRPDSRPDRPHADPRRGGG
mmetsp:Transcript_40036/g.128063  ORF Transcript_40036/g.128063 Transcript_40036/m.128063 type:complete len:232 (-) Transcript_40036:14-709(-)